MNLLLLVIAVGATAAAIVLGWLFTRLRTEVRRRSEIRVATLAGVIDARDAEQLGAGLEWAPGNGPTLFASEPVERGGGRPLIRIGVAAAMLTLIVVAVAVNGRRSSEATVADHPATRAATRGTAPLELVSMRHERIGDELRVWGLVRNPRTGGIVTRISAVVFAFNRAGGFIGSGRAGVDFITLEPGDESPFVVTVAGAGEVGRYRVSFRTDTGVVRHVDRRADHMRAAAAVE
jgi:hypothetical protein